MRTHFHVTIVGGGNAGLSAAAQLVRKDNVLQMGIIKPSEHHYYQPAWTLVGNSGVRHPGHRKIRT